jgi:uncharacterized protein YggE
MGDTLSRAVVVVLALAVLVALADSAIVRHQETPPPERLLVVRGSATVEVEPDIARISLGVKATRDTPKEAARIVSNGVESIKTALMGLGVSEEAMETSEL